MARSNARHPCSSSSCPRKRVSRAADTVLEAGPWTPAFAGVTEDEATEVICLVRTTSVVREICAKPSGRRNSDIKLGSTSTQGRYFAVDSLHMAGCANRAGEGWGGGYASSLFSRSAISSGAL